MTKQEYFRKKVGLISILGVTDQYIIDFLDVSGVDPNEDVTDRDEMDKLFLSLVLTILLKPDFAEGDLSIKYDRDAVLKWYSLEADRLEVENPLDKSNVVEDMSYLA